MSIDFRPAIVEKRQVCRGGSLYFESRSGRVNDNGSVEYSKWNMDLTIPHYGEAFCGKPSSLVDKILWIWGKRK